MSSERAVAGSEARRRRLTAGARYAQLLEVTAALVGEQSFHQVSIESVARAAGVTRGTVYQHFENLEDLFTAVVERETRRAQSQVELTTPGDLTHGDPLEVLLASLRAYLTAVQAHPATWRLILMPPQGAPQLLYERIADGRREVLAHLTAAVGLPTDELAGPDSVSANEPALTARMLSTIADEYARLILTDPQGWPAERLLTHARWWLQHASLR